MLKFIAIFFILLCFNNGLAENTALKLQSNPIIPYCDIVKNSKNYDGKILRVKASYLVTRESQMLYELSCNGPKYSAHARLDCADKSSCDAMRKKLSASLNGTFRQRRVELVFIGRFKGATQDGKRYGGQIGKESGFLYEFDIQQVEETRQIDSKVAWPD